MGSVKDDPMAVVNPSLQVIGIDKLRVIDASVMPRLPGGNTNAPTVMIGEKGADMILDLHGKGSNFKESSSRRDEL